MVVLLALALSACISARAVDTRMTAGCRGALPLDGQSEAQRVEDAEDCRVAVLDGRLHAGGYVLWNPLGVGSRERAIRGWHREFVECLRARQYSLPDAPSPAPR
jgi:hypothetical protein